MTAQQRWDVQNLIERFAYAAALSMAGMADYGYWPDERYESSRSNVNECLEMIEAHKNKMKREQK